MDYMVDFIEAKYHLAVAERMIEGYREYPEKRFLVGVINEGAKAVSRIIRAFFVYYGISGGNLDKFLMEVAPKHFDSVTSENLMKMLEVEKAQKISPIEFIKGDKIILLIHGKYRVLTASRIVEFIKSAGVAISKFPTGIKR
jgi:hypothetical protein